MAKAHTPRYTHLGTTPVFARSSYHRGIWNTTPPPMLSTPLSASTCFMRTLSPAAAAAADGADGAWEAGGGAPVDADAAGVSAAADESCAPACCCCCTCWGVCCAGGWGPRGGSWPTRGVARGTPASSADPGCCMLNSSQWLGAAACWLHHFPCFVKSRAFVCSCVVLLH